MSSAPTPAPDRDVYNKLMEIGETVSRTEVECKNLRREMLAPNGHIARIDGQFKELRAEVQTFAAKAGESKSFSDHLRGGWKLVLALVVLAELASHAGVVAQFLIR